MFRNAFGLRVNCANANFIKRKISTTSAVLSNGTGVSVEQQNPSCNTSGFFQEQVPSKHRNLRDATTLYQHTFSRNANLISKKEKDELLATFPDIIRDVKEFCVSEGLDEYMNHYLEMLEYNVPYGRLTPALVFLAVYKAVQSPENLTRENQRVANIMAWCAEMLKKVWIIADDITDASEFRGGRLCWHKKREIGIRAANDSQLLENLTQYILKKYLSGRSSYLPILELYHATHMETAITQTWDTLFVVNGKPQLDLYTLDTYFTKNTHRSSYCFLYFGTILALHLSEKCDEKMIKNAESIIFKLSYFFGVQNDVQDCFVDPSDYGKSGNDIREGKCSWPIVTALHRASPSQRKILEENFGRPEPECSAAVLALYDELDLRNVYLDYWKENYPIIRNYIQQTCGSLPPGPFLGILDYISGKIR